MITIAEYDEQVADELADRPDAIALYERFVYEPECDAEIKSSYVKLAIYLKCREQGVEPIFAAMRACRRASGVANTDRHFNESARRQMEGMRPVNRNKIVKIAEQAGISTSGKFYMGQLGQYADPAAWVSTIDDVKDVAKKKGLSITGAVKYESPEVPVVEKKVALAPDIVNDLVHKYTQHDPGLRERVRKNPTKLAELREKIVATHGRRR